MAADDILTPIRSTTNTVMSSHVPQSLRLTPTSSPSTRLAARSPVRPTQSIPSAATSQVSLTLERVVGTTTINPAGLACHQTSRSLAFCAGSAVVLAEVDEDFNLSQRFYRARPTAIPINATPSYYNNSNPQQTNAATPESRRRKSMAPTRLGAQQNYSPSSSPTREWIENGGSRTWTSRERIKTATAVCLSPNGRFLAVGETGYSPRVLIFSTARDVPQETPVSILTEHSFGVRAIAFSPDSQYLATLGDNNDGFLFVWAINSKTGAARLHSANRCTAWVNDMAWMGNSVVTVGTRHVKVWRVSDTSNQSSSPTKISKTNSDLEPPKASSPRALSGRNCLLGSLVDTKFTTVAAISDKEAIVCSSRGDICLIDDNDGHQQFKVSKSLGFKVNCITLDHDRSGVMLGGKDRRLRHEAIDDLRDLARSVQATPSGSQILPTTSSSVSLSNPNPFPTKSSESRKSDLIALASILGKVLIVDSDRSVSLAKPPPDNGEMRLDHGPQSMPAHRDAVQGVEILRGAERKIDFITWSRNGEVKCWNGQGELQESFGVELDQLDGEEDEVRNELKVVRSDGKGDLFVTGDRYGVVRVLRKTDDNRKHEIRAHGAELTDIALHHSNEVSYIATSGRDRMVQLFSTTSESLDIVQTMDDHVGAVNSVMFVKGGQNLLSSSSDRTVIVREQISKTVDDKKSIAFILTRVITMKASPISMALIPGEADQLMLSTMNHQVLRVDMRTGEHLHTFKSTDSENNDLVVLNSLTVGNRNNSEDLQIMAAVSSTDKSIRIYDLDRGLLLTREFGHSEGVSDVALLEHQDFDPTSDVSKTVISTGVDGTVMIWKLNMHQPVPLQEIGQGRGTGQIGSEGNVRPKKESIAMKPPLRRVLSRSELSEYMVLDPTNTSPSIRLRNQSPPRVRRKSSRPTLSSVMIGHTRARTSPSPPPLIPTLSSSSMKQRSPISNARDRSPSPPTSAATSPMLVPPSPKAPNRANNSRLRRPPSMPSMMRIKSWDRGNGSTNNGTTMPQKLEGPSLKTIPVIAEKNSGEQRLSSHQKVRSALQDYRTTLSDGLKKNDDSIRRDSGSHPGKADTSHDEDLKRELEEVRNELSTTMDVVDRRMRTLGITPPESLAGPTNQPDSKTKEDFHGVIVEDARQITSSPVTEEVEDRQAADIDNHAENGTVHRSVHGHDVRSDNTAVDGVDKVKSYAHDGLNSNGHGHLQRVEPEFTVTAKGADPDINFDVTGTIDSNLNAESNANTLLRTPSKPQTTTKDSLTSNNNSKKVLDADTKPPGPGSRSPSSNKKAAVSPLSSTSPVPNATATATSKGPIPSPRSSSASYTAQGNSNNTSNSSGNNNGTVLAGKRTAATANNSTHTGTTATAAGSGGGDGGVAYGNGSSGNGTTATSTGNPKETSQRGKVRAMISAFTGPRSGSGSGSGPAS